MTSCSSVQPRAGSPLARPFLSTLTLVLHAAAFFFHLRPTQQTPVGLILLCLQTCALQGWLWGSTQKHFPQQHCSLVPIFGHGLAPEGTASAACPRVWICSSDRENFLLVKQDSWYTSAGEGVRSNYCHTVRGNVLMYM